MSALPADAVTVFAIDGLPEIHPGDDLAGMLGDALDGTLEAGDILVITSKIVSKAEGRIIEAQIAKTRSPPRPAAWSPRASTRPVPPASSRPISGW
jgi:Uncharacterized conserved protein